MTQYIELTIVFGTRNADGCYAVTMRSAYGAASSVLNLPTADPEFQALLAGLLAFQTDETELGRLGQLLFAALFQDRQARSLYDQIRHAFQAAPDQRARLRLEFPSGAGELAGLPWELLSDPDLGPLALLGFSVVRCPTPALDQTTSPALPSLKLLLAAATAESPDSAEAGLAGVEEAVRVFGDRASVTIERRSTSQLLQRRLREGFQVWHLVAHTALKADGQGVLLLDNPGVAPGAPAAPFPLGPIQLQMLLSRSGVRLVVLDVRASGPLAADPFASLVPAILRAGVPAVVAARFSVPEQSSSVFAEAFYRALAEGLPVEQCVDEGRRAVAVAVGLDRPDWAALALYTSAADVRLLQAVSVAGTSQGGAPSGEVFRVGGVPTLDALQVTDRDGLPLLGVPSGDYVQELLRLSQDLGAYQRRIDLHKLSMARFGYDASPHIKIELEELEQQLYGLFKARAELRLGWLEELQRQAARGDQGAAQRLAEVIADYLDDAVELKTRELDLVRGEYPVNAAERIRRGQRLDELSQQIVLLRAQGEAARRASGA